MRTVSPWHRRCEFGLDPAIAGSDARQAQDVQAYLEAHIEQGPVLEAENLAVGWLLASLEQAFQCEVTGMAGHAGTVPVHLRQDAMTGAAEMILSIEIGERWGRCGNRLASVKLYPAR